MGSSNGMNAIDAQSLIGWPVKFYTGRSHHQHPMRGVIIDVQGDMVLVRPARHRALDVWIPARDAVVWVSGMHRQASRTGETIPSLSQ